MSKYFCDSYTPRIIINAGGFTQDAFMPKQDTKRYYNMISDSLKQINFGCTIPLIQTMPPFPWHFGGQRFQNLFLDPHEIKEFCTENGMNVCLDLSHSKLACNHFKWSFEEFLSVVLPHTDHLNVNLSRQFLDVIPNNL